MSGVQTLDGQSSFAFVKGELQEEDRFGRDTLGLCWAKEIPRSVLEGLAVWLPGDFVIKGFLVFFGEFVFQPLSSSCKATCYFVLFVHLFLLGVLN